MKRFYKMPIFIFLVAGLNLNIRSQNPPNGITTNPNNTSWSNPPYDMDYKKNAGLNFFDWRQEHINVYMSSFPFNQVTSPYYFDGTAVGLKGIAQGEDSTNKYDFYPEDGWELIRKDFGKKSDGTIITNESVIGPYYVLYNRYSATLRVIGWTSTSVGYFPTINVKLRFNQTNSVSGLFTYYNKLAQPLDMPTPISYATTPTFLSGAIGTPFYADFKLAYDPCTCYFTSNLNIDFEKVQAMDIQLYGRLLANNVPIDLVNSDNTLKDKSFLTSVYNQNFNDYKITAGMITYKYMDSLVADYQKSANEASNTQWLKDGLDILSKAATAGNSIATLTGNEGIGKALDVVSSLTDFFSTTLSPVGTSMPSVIHGEMSLKGKVLNKTDQNITIPIVNPGSLNSQNAPECCQGTGYYYPMYNEVLGVFALLETPEVTVTERAGDNYYNMLQMQLSAPLKYIFNPAVKVNLANSWIYTSLELNFLDGQYGSGFVNSFYRYKKTDGRSVYSTPSLPIESQGQLKMQIIDGNPYPASTVSFLFSYDTVRLSVMLDLEFQDSNRNGVPNRSLLVLTYPVSLRYVGDNSLSVFSATYYGPEFLTMPQQNYTSNQTSTAWKELTIAGTQTANNGVTSTLQAGNDVVINSGVSIGAGMTLKAISYPFAVDYSLRPQTVSASYCNSASYKANTVAASVKKADAQIDARMIAAEGKPHETTAYPNPAQNKVSFQYYLEESSNVKLSIQDITGRTLSVAVDGYQEAGAYNLAYETTGLPSGVYIYTIETSQGRESKRLVIAK